MAGRVRDVILKRTKEGLSRGMAIVEYEHPLEAVQAVSMFNEQQLFDRIMAVKIDLKDDGGQDDGRSMKLPSKHITIHFSLRFSIRRVEFSRWSEVHWRWFRHCWKSSANNE